MFTFNQKFVDTPLTDNEEVQLKKAGYNFPQYLEHYGNYVEMAPKQYLNPQDTDFEDKAILSILASGKLHINGVVTKKNDENMENDNFIPALKKIVDIVKAVHYSDKIHVIFYSDVDKAKGVHPQLVADLHLNGKYKLMPGGHLVAPGTPRPVASLTFDEPDSDGYRKKTLRVNGGRFGNMQKLADATTDEQFKVLELIRSILKGFWWTKEAYIHLLKLLAAAQFDYLRKEGVSKEECMDQFEKFCNPELTCKEQKSLGQKAQLSPVYFELTPDLSVMIKAFIDMLQAFLDPEFWEFLEECKNMGIEVWEAAIQGAFDRFGGTFHDTTWGSGGSAQLCIPAEALQEVSKKPRGIFGQGVKMLMDAMRGDERALAFLGLKAQVTQANLGESCVQLATKIWQCLEEANKLAEARAKAPDA